MEELLLLLLLSRFSRVRLCVTPWTAAYQASPSLGFSRQEHWSGLPFPSPMHENGKCKWSRSVVSNSFAKNVSDKRLLSNTSKNPAATAAAKSIQSCLTLCDPIDSNPPGSPVPGILQARTLEWVAISFSDSWKWKVKVKLHSLVRLLVTPWTVGYQAPPSMGFSRQECWSGVPLPSPKEPWKPNNKKMNYKWAKVK